MNSDSFCRVVLFLCRAALLGIVFIYVNYAVAIVSGSRPECTIAGPLQACR